MKAFICKPAPSFIEGFAGPRTMLRSSCRPRSSTRESSASAAVWSYASKKPKKIKLSPCVLLWLSSSMAAMRPTTSPSRSAKKRSTRACS